MFRALTLIALALLLGGCQQLNNLLQPAAPPSPSPSPPSGPRLYITDREHGILTVAESDNHIAEKFPLPSGASYAAVSPDNLLLYVTSSRANQLSIFQTTGFVSGRIPVGKQPYGVALSPDGHQAYIANQGEDTISIINLQTRQQLRRIPTGRQPYDVVASADGSRFFVCAHQENTVIAYDAKTFEEVGRNKVGLAPYCVTLDPGQGVDGARYLYVTVFDSNELVVLDTSSMLTVARVRVGEGPYDVVCSPDGHIFVSDSEAGAVTMLRRDAWGEPPVEHPVGVRPYGLALSHDFNRLYVSLEGEKRITVRSCADLTEMGTVDVGGIVPTEIVPGH